MTKRCRLFGHKWKHEYSTVYRCRRCHNVAYGMGITGKDEAYRPPDRRANTMVG